MVDTAVVCVAAAAGVVGGAGGIRFLSRRVGTRPDLLATCGDQLRIWNISDNAVVLDRLLSNVRTPSLNHVTLTATVSNSC